MNYYEEDGLHAIKLKAKVYLREIRMSLLLEWKWQLFCWSFFIFRKILKLVAFDYFFLVYNCGF